MTSNGSSFRAIHTGTAQWSMHSQIQRSTPSVDRNHFNSANAELDGFVGAQLHLLDPDQEGPQTLILGKVVASRPLPCASPIPHAGNMDDHFDRMPMKCPPSNAHVRWLTSRMLPAELDVAVA